MVTLFGNQHTIQKCFKYIILDFTTVAYQNSFEHMWKLFNFIVSASIYAIHRSSSHWRIYCTCMLMLPVLKKTPLIVSNGLDLNLASRNSFRSKLSKISCRYSKGIDILNHCYLGTQNLLQNSGITEISFILDGELFLC